MIPRANTATLDTNFGDRVSKQFSIAVNRTSFRVLLDTIYSDKPLAITRELWTNAYDSHVEAGCVDKPFTCKLPSPLDATFSVRDYGTSMSHDKIMDLYTELFGTSKDKSNSVVGQYGLGSKTPFSYTDTFTVIAWLDGYKRIYIANLDTEGVPMITPISNTWVGEGPGNERGIEVIFPVQDQHWSAFREAATKVAYGFDVKPEILGPELELKEPEYKGDGWAIYEGGVTGVRQGCVIYPVDFYRIGFTSPVAGAYSLVWDVPIGSVDIVASREALSYDDDTIHALKTTGALVKPRILEYAEEKLQDADNMLDAEFEFIRLQKIFNWRGKPKYNGRPLLGWVEFKAGDKNTPKITYPSGDAINARGEALRFDVRTLQNLRFIIDRSDKKILRRRMRIQKRAKDGGSKFSPQSRKAWTPKETVWVVVEPTHQQLRALVRRLNLKPDQIIPVATLPDPGPPYKATTSNAYTITTGGTTTATQWNITPPVMKRTGVYKFYGFHEIARYEDHNSIPKDYYWMPIEKAQASLVVALGSLGVETLGAWGAIFKEVIDGLGVAKKPVLMMLPGAVKRLDPDDSLLIETVILEAFEAKKQEVLDGITYAAYTQQSHRVRGSDKTLRELWKLVSKNAPRGHTVIPSKFRTIYATEVKAASIKGQELFKTAMDKFPLLTSEVYSVSTHPQHILDYIEWCTQ